MNYHNIRKYDIANGKHLRTTIFFTGCRFHCPDCFNREIWDFNSGKPFDEEILIKIADALEKKIGRLNLPKLD